MVILYKNVATEFVLDIDITSAYQMQVYKGSVLLDTYDLTIVNQTSQFTRFSLEIEIDAGQYSYKIIDHNNGGRLLVKLNDNDPVAKAEDLKNNVYL